MPAAMGFFLGTQEQVRNSRGNEPSVFEALKIVSNVTCLKIVNQRK